VYFVGMYIYWLTPFEIIGYFQAIIIIFTNYYRRKV
jgi:hypothetical protein